MRRLVNRNSGPWSTLVLVACFFSLAMQMPEARSQTSGEARSLLQAINVALREGDLVAAEARAEDLVHRERKSAEAHLRVGVLFARHEHFARAASYFAEAVRQRPQDASLRFNLSLALFRAGRLSEAGDHLERLLSEGDSADARYLLADVYESSGKHVKALEQYQKAVELAPENEEYWFGLALELLRHRTYDAAIHVLGPAVERFPASFRLKVALALGYFARRQYDGAVDALLEASKLEPGSETAHRMLAAACENRARWGREVIRSFEAFSQEKPKSPWGPYWRARALLQEQEGVSTKETEHVRRLYDEATSRDPGHAESHYGLGLLHARAGDREQALKAFQRAAQIRRDWAQAHFQLGRLHRLLGDREAARRHFQIHQELQAAQASEREERRRQVERFVLSLE